MSVFEGDLVEGSVIDTNPGAAVGFLCEDEGKAPGGFRFRDDAVLEVFIDELLDLLKIPRGMCVRTDIDGLGIACVNIKRFHVSRASDLT